MKSLKDEIRLIGLDKKGGCSKKKKTQKQVNEIIKLPIDIYHLSEKVEWSDIYDPNRSDSLFQHIINDREMRVDKKMYMNERPSFSVITIREGIVVRFEFYSGHNDDIEVDYDFRSPKLNGDNLIVNLWGNE